MPAVAQAEGEGSWLHYDVPPECPGAEAIVAQVEKWLHRPFPQPSPIAADGRAFWSAGKWQVEVALSSRQASGSRSIRVDHCSEAADFVAITIVLALEPGFLIEAGDTQPVVETSETGQAAQTHRAKAPSGRADSRGSRASPKDAEDVASDGRSFRSQPSPNFFTAALTFEGVSGVIPRWAWGVGAELGWQRNIFGLHAGGFALPPRTVDEDSAASAVRFLLIGAKVGACLLLPSRQRWRLGPCIETRLGSYVTSSTNLDGTKREERSLWWSAQLGARSSVRLGSMFELLAGVSASLPLVWPHLVLTDDSEIYRSSPGFAAEVGLRLVIDARSRKK